MGRKGCWCPASAELELSVKEMTLVDRSLPTETAKT
jgi:hypothetical protein